MYKRQELRFEDDRASRRALVAFYEDQVHSPVIGGGGSLVQQDLAGGDVLYDPVSQVFRVTGPGYTTGGFRAAFAQKVGTSTLSLIHILVELEGEGEAALNGPFVLGEVKGAAVAREEGTIALRKQIANVD